MVLMIGREGCSGSRRDEPGAAPIVRRTSLPTSGELLSSSAANWTRAQRWRSLSALSGRRRERMGNPHLMALLLDEPRGRRRRLSYRGQEHDEVVPSRVQTLPAGTPVLLVGAPGRWERGFAVGLTRWDKQPSVEALRAGRLRTERLRLDDVQRGGVWSSDAEGRACELAEYESREHGRAGVISYAGWRITDLVGRSAEAVVTKAGDRIYYVIPSRAVPAELIARAEPTRGLVAPPPAPAGIPAEWVVPFDDLDLLDGALRVRTPDGQVLCISEPRSRGEYSAVKDILKRYFPNGIRVGGTRYGGLWRDVRVRDLDALGRIFKEAPPATYLREIVKDGGWHRAGEIARRLAGPEGAPPADDLLLTLSELGFDRRRDAFARIFKLRDEQREVLVQPNRAMLIPVRAADGGPGFWVWELVEEGNATYLFRPRDRAMESHLLDWLRDPHMRRQDLLDSKDLQTRVGFARRVIHREADEPLDSWWARLCEALQATSGGSPANRM
ncbi:MAG: hypothetical protein U0359_11150 [Byssovorax sp.]